MNKKTDRKLSNRIDWVDMVKGFIIILVVLGHKIQFGSGADYLNEKLYFNNLLFRLFYSFHMPCLMLISGFFFKYSIDKPGMWKRKVETILIPTVAWTLIPIGLTVIKAFLKKQLGIELFFVCARTMFTYLWFLWAILFCSAIVWGIHKFFNDSVLLYIVIAIMLLFIPDWLNMKLWKYMYPYFVFGYFWKKPKWIDDYKLAIEIGLIIVFLLLFSRYDSNSFIYTTGITVRSLEQLEIDIYRYLIGYVGSAMIIWTFYCINQQKKNCVANEVLTYCGRISLTIYIVDAILSNFVLAKLTNGASFNYVLIILETIIVILLCILVDIIIKKNSVGRKILLGSR